MPLLISSKLFVSFMLPLSFVFEQLSCSFSVIHKYLGFFQPHVGILVTDWQPGLSCSVHAPPIAPVAVEEEKNDRDQLGGLRVRVNSFLFNIVLGMERANAFPLNVGQAADYFVAIIASPIVSANQLHIFSTPVQIDSSGCMSLALKNLTKFYSHFNWPRECSVFNWAALPGLMQNV